MSKVLLKIRESGKIRKASRLVKSCLVIMLAFASGVIMLAGSYSDNINTGLSDSLVRLHVIANSDSPEDQALKHDVRDAVIIYMKELLKDSKDINQTHAIIKESLDSIKNEAEKVIAQKGSVYKIEVNFGKWQFPTKLYGDIALPAGTYNALRITIGKGEGANWWCVLFPPLCFVDATHGTVPESVKNELKSVLTDEEYDLINAVDNDDDIPVKIKFKIVEVFENSKIRFTGVLNKIFSAGKK